MLVSALHKPPSWLRALCSAVLVPYNNTTKLRQVSLKLLLLAANLRDWLDLEGIISYYGWPGKAPVAFTLTSNPAVDDCAVVKKKDSARSFVPVAFVVIKPECSKSDKDSVKQSCIGKLDKCSIPTEWYLLDSLPLTTAGKVDYQALEEMAEDRIEG